MNRNNAAPANKGCAVEYSPCRLELFSPSTEASSLKKVQFLTRMATAALVLAACTATARADAPLRAVPPAYDQSPVAFKAGERRPFQFQKDLVLEMYNSGTEKAFSAKLYGAGGMTCLLSAKAINISLDSNVGDLSGNHAAGSRLELVAPPGALIKCDNWPAWLQARGHFVPTPGHTGWVPMQYSYCSSRGSHQHCYARSGVVEPAAVGVWEFTAPITLPPSFLAAASGH